MLSPLFFLPLWYKINKTNAMKKLFFMLGALMLSIVSQAATINKIDPPYWYAGLQHHELQLMVYGNDIGFSQVSTDYLREPQLPAGVSEHQGCQARQDAAHFQERQPGTEAGI